MYRILAAGYRGFRCYHWLLMESAARAPRSLTSQDIGRHYDQFAWAYRRYWGDHIHHGLFRDGVDDSGQAQELMLRHCANRAGVQPGMTVADVGCGHGGTAIFLAREHSCKVLGLTISKTQWKLAEENARPVNGHVHFELGDAESYPFPESAFDLIWNMESTEHFFDKPAYLRKAAAALKPGGKLMVAAWTGLMQDELVRNIAKVFLCPQLWPAEEYVRHIESAGMNIVSFEQLNMEVMRTWDVAAESVRRSSLLLSILPAEFHEFAHGIELMREGYQSGKLSYSVIVASKHAEPPARSSKIG